MRKKARTIPIPAKDGDSGRETVDQGNYFRCWNCGFICDIRRDELSKDGRRGTTYALGTVTSHGDTNLNYGVGEAVNLSTGVGEDSILDAGNRPVVNVMTVGGSGCPLCHSTAWKKL